MKIDFKLKPYEWQKSMEIVLTDVNLDKVNILDNGEIVFDFIDSYSGRFYKQMICSDVWKISVDMNLGPKEQFPIFIGDVRVIKLDKENVKEAYAYLGYGFEIPESKEYNLVCIESGEISIVLVCGRVEIIEG